MAPRSSSTRARAAPTRLRRSDRAGEGRAGDQGQRRASRPHRAARRPHRDRDRHRQEPGGAGAASPRHRPRAGGGGRGALARDQGLDRPADRGRLLLRLRVPQRRPADRVRPREDRGEDARARRRRRGLRAQRRHGGGGPRALRVGGPALQGRADRRPRGRRGRGDGLALPQRALPRPLPRPARAVDWSDRRAEAHLARGRLLARGREAPDADPHLRHRLLQAEGPRRPPGADRAGQGARSPPPRPRAGPVHAAPGGSRDALLVARGHRAPAPDRGRGPRAAAPRRVRRDQDAAGARRGALAPLRPLGQLPREHVLRRALRARGRPAPLRAEADELPRRLPGVRLAQALLPRPARSGYADFGRLARSERKGYASRPSPGPQPSPQDDAHVFCMPEQMGARSTSDLPGHRRCLSRASFRRSGRVARPGPEKSRSAPTRVGSARRGAGAMRYGRRGASTK